LAERKKDGKNHGESKKTLDREWPSHGRTYRDFYRNFTAEWVYEIQFLGCEVLNFDQATNHLPSSGSNWSS
jgi:hypothetical protein